MKIAIIGQCQGGNAVLWFELFNNHLSEFNEIDDLLYICRTENELKGSFKIKELYGGKSTNDVIKKFKTRLVSRIYSKLYFKFCLSSKLDIIHIQGNYSPSFNLNILNNTGARSVLHIMGSDFYQNYLKKRSRPRDRITFIEVLNKVDHIVCSRETSRNDLLKSIPILKNKISVIRLGTSEKWVRKSSQDIFTIKNKKKNLLYISTRGLYDYNNIETLVEAFCIAFNNIPEKNVQLKIINGYGNHPEVVKSVKSIIKTHKCEDIVELNINEWISEKELMDIYEQADYNFCIGNTDQLSISITYGFLKLAQNILSPIDTYHELIQSGYQSLQILEEISVESLVLFFKNSHSTKNKDALINDRIKSAKEHLAKNNYKKYIGIYKKLLNQ
jgi:hypothetical protein